MNNLYLAKVNVVNPYSIEYLGGMNTCISSFNSYMTVVYKSDDKAQNCCCNTKKRGDKKALKYSVSYL